MTQWRELVRQIDSCHSLFLREIGEPDENSVRLVLCEGKVSAETVSIQVGGTTIAGGHKVQVTEESRIIELTWPSYISYSITNESFAAPEGTRTADSGRLLRRYSDSSFLTYVAHSTIADEEYPGHYEHLQVVSENHIVDVVSMEMPTLRLLNPFRS